MSIGGGLVPSTDIPKGNRHSGYENVGDGRWQHLPNGLNLAQAYKKGDEVPPGYCVVNISHGDNVSEGGPVPVTHGDFTLVIPRGSDRLVPIGHVNILNDAVETHYFQHDITEQMGARHSRRFDFQVRKWPKTGENVGVVFEKDDLESAIERHEVIDLNQDE